MTIVSTDKDLLQLVREEEDTDDRTRGRVSLAHPFKRTVRGVAEVELAYGVRP